jgi:hypothetical protein
MVNASAPGMDLGAFTDADTGKFAVLIGNGANIGRFLRGKLCRAEVNGDRGWGGTLGREGDLESDGREGSKDLSVDRRHRSPLQY